MKIKKMFTNAMALGLDFVAPQFHFLRLMERLIRFILLYISKSTDGTALVEEFELSPFADKRINFPNIFQFNYPIYERKSLQNSL